MGTPECNDDNLFFGPKWLEPSGLSQVASEVEASAKVCDDLAANGHTLFCTSCVPTCGYDPFRGPTSSAGDDNHRD